MDKKYNVAPIAGRQRHCWADGHNVNTVGINEATDKLSVREYEDPFGEDKEIRKKNK